MSTGTASSAEAPERRTKPAGARAAPEKCSSKNQRASKTPGARNSTSVPITRTIGNAARASRSNSTITKAAPPENATAASKRRRRDKVLPTTLPGRTAERYLPGGSRTVWLALRRPDRHRGTEVPPRSVRGLHADVVLRGARLDDGLETASGDGVQGLQLVGGGTGEHQPRRHIGGPVPAGVECDLVLGAGLGRYGGG